MRTPFLAATFVLSAATAVAENVDTQANPLLPVGVVACISVKDLQNYQTYLTTAPAFAKDLLDRAACYISETEQPAVVVGGQPGYTRYKLLSGHKVWVANVASGGK